MGTNWNHIGRAGRARHAAQRLAERYGAALPRNALKKLAAYLRARSPNVIPGPGMRAPDADRAVLIKQISRGQEIWLIHPAVLGLHRHGSGHTPAQGQGDPHWIKVVYDRHKGRVATVLSAADSREP